MKKNSISFDISFLMMGDSSRKSVSLDQIYISLEAALDKIISSKQCDALAISGGADSRLIMSILNKNHRSELEKLYIYNRRHISLEEDTDVDTVLSKKICERLGLKLNLEVSQRFSGSYLHPEGRSENKVLSGLWGGELLGGYLVDDRLFSFEELLVNTESELASFVKTHFEKESQSSNILCMMYNLLRWSNYTAYYQSLPWLRPRANEARTVTPFLDEGFLKALFSIKSEDLSNYQLYKKLLNKHCAELLDIPINNPSFKELYDYGDVAKVKNPKSIKVVNKIPQDWTSEKKEIRRYIEQLGPSKYGNYLLKALPYIRQTL
ncbi:MAG: hypothetical protein HRT44_02125 [Bdellovibrionales bacterium]|nr:hypothetical protein [Bdellovibrionales bacterium]